MTDYESSDYKQFNYDYNDTDSDEDFDQFNYEYNDTDSHDDFELQNSHADGLKEFNKNLVLTILIIVLVLSIAAFVYGVTSWCALKKFRNNRNFVCLNMIFVNFLLDALYLITDDISPIIILLFMFLGTAKHCWLLVISHMFYVDIVKVFNGNTRRKYLKNCLFGWGIPLIPVIICLVMYYLDVEIGFAFNTILMTAFVAFLPLVVNFIIYIIVLICICRSCFTRLVTGTKNRRRFYIATLIFILTDSLLLLRYFIHYLYISNGPFHEIVQVLLTLLFYSNTILMDVFIVCVKSNREIWTEYRARIQQSQQLEMEMRRIGGAPTV